MSCGLKGDGEGARALRCRTDARSRAFKAGSTVGIKATLREVSDRAAWGRRNRADEDGGRTLRRRIRSERGRFVRKSAATSGPAAETPRREIFLPAVSVLELAADFPAKCRRAPATTLSHSLGCEDDGGEHVGGGGREHRLSALRCVNLRVDEAREPASGRRDARPRSLRASLDIQDAAAPSQCGAERLFHE